ncbi:MAG: hypothetical protein LBI84_09310, partial [Propionibacteriaceae bacterium]|nr:hypothetical protein [Propionibacteriaceae bacterium]
MTAPPPADALQPSSWKAKAAGIAALAAGQAALLLMANIWDPDSASDVRGIYHIWMTQGQSGQWPVLSVPWVYPFLALAPLRLALALEPLLGGYVFSWCLIVAALDIAACAVVWRQFGFRRGNRGVCWWQAAAVLAGPVPMGRLDGIVVPVMVAGLAYAGSRPKAAAVLLTLGAWIKVIPGGAFLALAATGRDRLKRFVGPALAASAAVMALAALMGASFGNIISFLTIQIGRRLQIEAVAGTPIIVYRRFVPGDLMVWNGDTLTLEFSVPAAEIAARLCGLLLPLAAVAITWLAYRAAAAGGLSRFEICLTAAAAELSAMIVFNQVGSLQFVCWVFPAAAVGLAAFGQDRWWRAMAALATAAAVLTRPIAQRYMSFLALDWDMLAIFVLRNAAYVAILVVAVKRLWPWAKRAGLFRLYDDPAPAAGRLGQNRLAGKTF